MDSPRYTNCPQVWYTVLLLVSLYIQCIYLGEILVQGLLMKQPLVLFSF